MFVTWIRGHRQLLAYLFFVAVVIVLFSMAQDNRHRIEEQSRDRSTLLCQQQNENKSLIFEIVDFQVDQWGADRIELAASIEDPALRRMVLELIQQQEEFRGYVREQTTPLDCYSNDIIQRGR